MFKKNWALKVNMFKKNWALNGHMFKINWALKVHMFKKNWALNPIPAGVLENQDTLGGGQFDPPL